MCPDRLFHGISRTPGLGPLALGARSLVRAYFDWALRNDTTPFGEDGEAEYEKYTRILHALDFKGHFKNVLDLGCGEGYLMRRLAGRAGRILGVDISPTVIRRAGRRLAPFDNVELRAADALTEEIEESFELVLCSELLYYFNIKQFGTIAGKIERWTRPGGYLLLAHSRAAADDEEGSEPFAFGAKTIHDTFLENPVFHAESDITYPAYRITVLRK